jgi:tetratricopeptide (TPR) repeat protein
MMGVGHLPPERPPPLHPPVDFSGAGLGDDPFANLPAAKPTLGGPPRPTRQPHPPAGATPAFDEFDAIMDLPAVTTEQSALPTVVRRPVAGKPPTPAKPPAPWIEDTHADAPSLTDFDMDLPSPQVDLPAAKPAAARRPGISFDLDLPSPAADLPTARSGRQSPGISRDQADLPVVGGVALPATKTAIGFGEIDLPLMGENLPAVPARDHNLPVTIAAGLPLPVVGSALPVVVSAGLPGVLGNEPYLPNVANVLPVPSLHSTARSPIESLPHTDASEIDFGELELNSVPPQAQQDELAHDDLMEELELPPPRDPERASASGGGVGFGEVDLGGDSGESVATLDVPRTSQEVSLSGPVSGSGEAAVLIAPSKRRERAQEDAAPSRAPRIVFALLFGVVVIGGSLLQLTPHGAFGYVFINDLVHEGGWLQLANEASNKARAAMAKDVFDQTNVALEELASLRAESPRAKPLTAYAALAEYEGELRFGKDGGRAARAQAWLTELSAKGPSAADIRYFAVATAAQAAVNGDYPTARASLDVAARKDVGDPIQQDVVFTRGELELAAGDATAAVSAFTKAIQLSPSARAHFGLARAYALGGDPAKARAEIAATLAASPQHAGALELRASLAWLNEKNETSAVKDVHEVLEGSAKAAASPRELSKAQALRGWIEAARGKTAEARASFETALKLDPRNADALVGQGEVLYTEGRYTEALSRFDTAAQIDPRNTAAIVSDAKAKIALERLADAKNQLTAARTAYPTEMSIAYWLGKAEQALGNKKAAEDAFLAAIGLANVSKPEAIEPYVALAEMLAGQGRAVEAQAKLNEAKGKLPDSATMQRALGEVAAVQGLYDEAIGHYQSAVDKGPEDLSSRFLLGVTYRRMQRVDLAAAEFDKVFAADRDYPGLAMERGLLFEQSGQIEKALEQFRAALEKAPDDLDLQLRVGAAYVGVHHPDDALLILKKVIGKRQNSAEANHYLGRAFFQKGGLAMPDATRYLKRAVELDPNRAEYHLYLAWVATETVPADLSTARTEVDKALSLDKLLGDAYWQRGVVERIAGAVDDAIRDLKHALELRPTRFEAHATLAECYEDKNDFAAAMTEWTRALAGDDTRPAWRYRFGLILADRGNVGAALPHLVFAINAAEKETPVPGWALQGEFRVAEAYRKTGHKADAVDHYNRFLDSAAQSNPDRRDALNALSALGQPRGQ